MRARHFLLEALVMIVLFTNTSCRGKKDAPSSVESDSKAAEDTKTAAPATTAFLHLPLAIEDPAFAAKWKASLLNLPHDPSTPPHFAEPSRGSTPSQAYLDLRSSPIPTSWRMKTEEWMMEAGGLYRLGLVAGTGFQEIRTWTRVLRETLALIENPQPSPPFQSSVKLFVSSAEASTPPATTPWNRFIEVQPHPQSSPLAREACEVFRKWFSVRQLLAGRSQRALSRNKESIVLYCSLVPWENEIRPLPFLQVAELPLPLVEAEKQTLMFRNPADLIRSDKLQILLEMN